MKENQVPGSNQGKKASGSAPWKKIKYLKVPEEKDKYLEVLNERKSSTCMYSIKEFKYLKVLYEKN